MKRRPLRLSPVRVRLGLVGSGRRVVEGLGLRFRSGSLSWSDNVADRVLVRRRRVVDGRGGGLLVVRHLVRRRVRHGRLQVRHRVGGVVHVPVHRLGVVHHVWLFDDRHVRRRKVDPGQDRWRHVAVRRRGVRDRGQRREDYLKRRPRVIIRNVEFTDNQFFGKFTANVYEKIQ